MALTPEQRKNAQAILTVGKQMGASKKALKAALEAGITESSLRNLPYGDRDSVGVFQQRPSQGWTGLTNVSKAAQEFFKQAIPNAGKYGTAGQLAQSVQRSAYPGRYDQNSAQANALLGGVSAPATGAPAGYGGITAGGTDKRALALSLLGMGNLGGYGGGDPLTLALQQATQQTPKAASYGPAPTASASGRLIGQPQDRPGAHTSKAILSFVGQVAGVYGKPIRLGTGTAHNEYVQGTNRVSAHWGGNALDLPAAGTALTSMGRAALIAAGMSPAQAKNEKGGIYNIGGKQIIFNAAGHFDHLHVGLRSGQ